MLAPVLVVDTARLPGGVTQLTLYATAAGAGEAGAGAPYAHPRCGAPGRPAGPAARAHSWKMRRWGPLRIPPPPGGPRRELSPPAVSMAPIVTVNASAPALTVSGAVW